VIFEPDCIREGGLGCTSVSPSQALSVYDGCRFCSFDQYGDCDQKPAMGKTEKKGAARRLLGGGVGALGYGYGAYVAPAVVAAPYIAAPVYAGSYGVAPYAVGGYYGGGLGYGGGYRVGGFGIGGYRGGFRRGALWG
jgi:hypothetical protein